MREGDGQAKPEGHLMMGGHRGSETRKACPAPQGRPRWHPRGVAPVQSQEHPRAGKEGEPLEAQAQASVALHGGDRGVGEDVAVLVA